MIYISYCQAHRLIFHDAKHSDLEERWFCIGKVQDCVLTVRFTYRDGIIRIFGAAEWRNFYEEHNL